MKTDVNSREQTATPIDLAEIMHFWTGYKALIPVKANDCFLDY
jgi:hypothetical protein